MITNGGLLRVKGTDIVDGNGQRVILKGVSQTSIPVYAQLTTKLNSVPQADI
jgi:hypothetical protein